MTSRPGVPYTHAMNKLAGGIMRRLMALWGVAAALAAAPALADDGVKLGATYSGVLPVKIYGSPQVPLPPGEWKLVSIGGTRSETYNIRIVSGHLIQTQGNVVKGRVSFVAPDGYSRGGWATPNHCGRKDVFMNISKGAMTMGYDCAFLNATGMARTEKMPKELGEFYDYVDQNKLKKPATAVYASYAISDGRTYLMVDYLFNPDLEGVPPAAASLWQRGYKDVAKRESYVEVLKAWTQTWRDNVALGYRGKLPASFAAAEIFPPAAKTAPPAKNQNDSRAPERVAELGKTYRDVFPLNVQGSPQLPLPPGDWKLIVLGEGVSEKEKVRLIRGYLIQTKNGAIAGRVYFNVPDGLSSAGWAPSDNCTRKDPIIDLSVNRGGAGKPYDCVSISAYQMARPKSGMPQLMQFHDYLDVNGIKRPATMINVGYGLSNGKSFVTAEYMFNPELDGVRAGDVRCLAAGALR